MKDSKRCGDMYRGSSLRMFISWAWSGTKGFPRRSLSLKRNFWGSSSNSDSFISSTSKGTSHKETYFGLNNYFPLFSKNPKKWPAPPNKIS